MQIPISNHFNKYFRAPAARTGDLGMQTLRGVHVYVADAGLLSLAKIPGGSEEGFNLLFVLDQYGFECYVSSLLLTGGTTSTNDFL